MKLTLQVPEENILSIASFLSIRDVLSLAWTCRSIRAALITSQGATKCIWMCRMQEAFPEVFRRAAGRSPFGMSEEEGKGEGGGHVITSRLTSRTAIDDESELVVCRLPGTSDEINLPLLTHLLPQRYPKSIDPSILKAELGHEPFRLYEGKSSIFLKDEMKVILVQFEGQVGTGDRCIRADQPFPSNCREVSPASSNKRSISPAYIRGKENTMKKNSLTLRMLKVMKMTHIKSRTNYGRRQNDGSNCLRPFVIPTIISDTRSTKRNEHAGWLVDVTPCFAAYFEVTIMEHPQDSPSPESTDVNRRRECVAIGLSTVSFRLQGKMPGWDFESYGYHSDDGSMFHGRGIPPRRGQPSYCPGDVVGCGLQYTSRKIFFTKNGQFLGYEFDKVGEDIVESGLYPTVGVDTKCPIHVNFGERPFHFDFKNIDY
jgi:hypothetical protein